MRVAAAVGTSDGEESLVTHAGLTLDGWRRLGEPRSAAVAAELLNQRPELIWRAGVHARDDQAGPLWAESGAPHCMSRGWPIPGSCRSGRSTVTRRWWISPTNAGGTRDESASGPQSTGAPAMCGCVLVVVCSSASTRATVAPAQTIGAPYSGRRRAPGRSAHRVLTKRLTVRSRRWSVVSARCPVMPRAARSGDARTCRWSGTRGTFTARGRRRAEAATEPPGSGGISMLSVTTCPVT